MIKKERNRGKEAKDDKLFGPEAQLIIKEALTDYCYLLTKGHAQKSSVQLVGNRYRLGARQQKVLLNMGAGKQSIQNRKKRSVNVKDLAEGIVEIDAFNLIILLEGILSGAYVFRGADGFYRDISGVHGSYKRVSKTEEVLLWIGSFLFEHGVKEVHWLIDRPVSNSGRMASMLREIGDKNNWNWKCELVFNPDKELVNSSHIVITSDAWILDRAVRNFNLPHYLISNKTHHENIVII